MSTRAHYQFAAGIVLAVAVSSCVSSARYDLAVKDADDAKAQLNAVTAKDQDAERQLAETRVKLNDAMQEEARLTAELEKLGVTQGALSAEKGHLASALAESRARFEELRKAKTVADNRAQLYRDLAVRLKKMVDAGDLNIALRDGRMTLQLPNDVLFDSGEVALKPAGVAALKQVAAVLRTLGSRHFQIAGHTDNVPIETSRYPSNWELSTARGVEVVRFLIHEGVPATSLAAAGYGEFDPFDTNANPRGRSKNRRIEITLQPNVDELVAVPESR